MKFYRWRQNRIKKLVFAFCLCAFLVFSLAFSGCKSSTVTPPSGVVVQEIDASKKVPETLTLKDPAKETFWWEYHQSLGKAWERFLQDGRYRLALPEDFNFSEAAKKSINKRGNWQRDATEPYQFWCMGFVAIVVDTSKVGDNRFGLICFPEKWKEDGLVAQKPYWLFVNKDLSKAILSRASCHHWVFEYADDGSEKTHYLNFDKRNNKYAFSD
jgi:hypothetical protein